MPSPSPSPSPVASGIITLIVGCMFAGKTNELLDMLRRVPADRRRAFKHVIDTRYQLDALVSHNGKRMPAVRIASAREMLEQVPGGVECVALEEVHFFDESLIEVVKTLARRGVNVMLTGLDYDTWGHPIAVVQQLRAIADVCNVLRGVCVKCGAPADRSHRLTPIIDGNLVGGPESFEPRCQACWSPPPQPPIGG